MTKDYAANLARALFAFDEAHRHVPKGSPLEGTALNHARIQEVCDAISKTVSVAEAHWIIRESLSRLFTNSGYEYGEHPPAVRQRKPVKQVTPGLPGLT